MSKKYKSNENIYLTHCNQLQYSLDSRIRGNDGLCGDDELCGNDGLLYRNIIIAVMILLLPVSAYAICPICTIAVGAGVGVAHWLGIDDTVTGLWIGGLVVSLIGWTIYWMDSKDIRFKGRKIIITVAYYLIIIVPLYYPMRLIGNPLNTLWGVDKLLLGIIIGSIAFFVGAVSYAIMKKHHNDLAYFSTQKVVMPIAPLIVLSAVFYFISLTN